METLTIPKVHFKEQIEKYRNMAFKNEREADSWYLECANFVYDIYEAVCELETDAKKINAAEISEAIDYFEKLKLEVTEFLDLLEDKYFDCKNFDRLNNELGTMEEQLPGIIEQLKLYSQSLK